MDKTPTNSSAKPQSRRRRRRQSQPNSIQIENSENGKSTTVLPPNTDDIIEIVNGNIGNPTNNNHHIVFDGPLDPGSNYTGYLEVIGKMCELKIDFVD